MDEADGQPECWDRASTVGCPTGKELAVASKAREEAIETVLRDVRALLGQKEMIQLKFGGAWDFGAIHRSAVIVSVAAWEGFIEGLVREAVGALRPQPNATAGWFPVLDALAQSSTDRFNTPNAEQVRRILSTTLGLGDVRNVWQQPGDPTPSWADRLDDLLKLRHRLAHGALPRSEVSHEDAQAALDLVLLLAERTDHAVRDHLIANFGVTPWS